MTPQYAATARAAHLCAACARRAGLDAAGSAYAYRHVLAVETPLPWPASMYSQAGVLPQELLDVQRLAAQAYQRGEPLGIGALAIAPDAAYSVAGMRRVISYRRPEGPLAAFTQDEYLVPHGEVGPLCWALLAGGGAQERFGARRLPPGAARDLMVCTHGSVDAACATLGFPVYRELRALAEAPHSGMRVWRVSHFGGHVFAPTLIDMPEFRYWGYAEREVAAQIAARAGHGLQLRDHYRGWAALDSPFLQAAERELFGLHGWAWSALHKSGHVLRGGPAWADVRIEYATPAGRQRGAYAARVELCGYVECIASTYDEQPFRFPQYDVVALDHRAL